jgi:hypothetical protein
MRNRIASLLIISLISAVGACTSPAFAWGLTGHTLISRAGAASFPTFLPGFVRTDAAIDEIAALGPELDRSKDAGYTHDRDLDPGHYADIGDDGTIFGIDLTNLPKTREAFDTALRRAGSDEYKAGYLPYALIDGWEQIAKDFAIWRVDDAGAKRSATADDRAWFAADRALRETLTIRDIGIWSHYVGDASQPLHVTVHFNGWGDYPNPNGYTESKTIHADFESSFVREHATYDAVIAHMAAPQPSSAPIATLVATYLAATASHVVPLYELDKHGAFANAAPEAIDFTDARLADGAAELRDLVADAWNASGAMKVGYPHAVTPNDVDSGIAFPTRAIVGGSD